MHFLTFTLFILFVQIQIAKLITISPNVAKNIAPTKSPQKIPLKKIESEYLNQTERHRRLIPYMTFYIPTNDYFPVNQAYSLMPPTTSTQEQQQEHQNQHQQQQPYPTQMVNLYQQQVQHSQPQQHSYQHHQQPQQYQQQNNKQPFYNNINKYVNNRPYSIAYNTHHQANKPYEVQNQHNTKTQRVNYNNVKQLKLQAQAAKEPLTPFLPSNQVPGKFRPMHYSDIEDGFQPKSPSIIASSSRPMIKSQIGYNAYDDQIKSNFIALIKPHNFFQIGGETSEVQQDIQQQQQIQPPQHHQLPQPLPEKPQIIYNQHPIPTSYIPYKDKLEQQDIPPPQSYKQYSNIDYNLDPNDGYERRVPQKERLVASRPNNDNKYKNYKLLSVTPPTPLPYHQSVSTQSYRYLQHSDDVYENNDSNNRPLTTIAPKQHLTETTQIQPPTISTYYPTAIPPTQQHNYNSNPYVKINKIIHSQSSPIPLQEQPIIVTQNPINNIQKPIENDVLHANTNAHTQITDVLRKLQASNLLPQILNSENLDDSIQSLVKILNNLKQSQHVAERPPQHHHDIDYEDNVDYNNAEGDGNEKPNNGAYEEPLGPNSGRPGIDYPALSEIPETNFNCKEQRYKGFFGDPETNCQVWHYCDLNGGQASFLCPNGTIFSQVALTCDWWFNVKCSTTTQLYVLNERLYKYILPFNPKFPEDYSGPLVDKYLAIKFKEMEEKMRRQKEKGKSDTDTTESDDIQTTSEHADDSDDKNTSDDEIISSTVLNVPQEPIIDDDGQSHNIDNAVQYENEPPPQQLHGNNENDHQDFRENNYGSTTTLSVPNNNNKYISTTTNSNTADDIQQHRQRSSNSGTDKIEFEKIEVVEIKSDGTTGHLFPRQYHHK